MERGFDLREIPLARGESIRGAYPLLEIRPKFSVLLFVLLLLMGILPGVIYFLCTKRVFVRVGIAVTNHRVVFVEHRGQIFGQQYLAVSAENEKLAVSDVQYGSYYERFWVFFKRHFDALHVTLSTRNLSLVEAAYARGRITADDVATARDHCFRALDQISGTSLEEGLNART